jgi:tRNA(Ile)-lysidine synthase
MDALAERVIATIERHAMFAACQCIGVAVSGGADSMCLLHLLHEIAPRWNLCLCVVHVEHGIRGLSSSQDAAFVLDAATAFGLPFHLCSANVPAIEDNLEQAAREVIA